MPYLMLITILQTGTTYYGPTNCGILPSWMGEHGVSWEDMENTGNMEDLE